MSPGMSSTIPAASNEAAFLDFSHRKLAQLAGRIQDCLDQLNDDKAWARGAANENAVGNLVLHLRGNITQWIGSGVAGRPDNRQRDAEFAAKGNIPVAELKRLLLEAVDDVCGTVKALPPERLSDRTTIQGYDVTVLEAIYHVVEHFSGHTGQILFVTKLLTGSDLAFYAHLRSRTEHEERTP